MIKISKCGTGSYGTVYESKFKKEDKNNIAVKRNIIDADISFSGSIKELDLLNRLRGHPYIVKLLSVSFGSPFVVPNSPIMNKKGENYKEDYLHFIFEKGDKNLHNLIHEKVVHVGYLKLSMVQILLSVEYMHSKGVIHRDIKPANLLWFVEDGKTSVKLCDFGLSKIQTNQEPASPHVVTCWYRAPEICSRNDYSFSSDMWSVGCVLYEMISKSPLLLGYKDDDTKILSKIIGLSPKATAEDISRLTKGNKIKLTKEASPKIRKTWRQMINLTPSEIEEFNKYSGIEDNYDNFLDLLEKILNLDPNVRLTAGDALNHIFFEPHRELIDWVRTNHPPVKKTEPCIEIIDCIERKWASQVLFKIFNNRENLKWYKHRILFQSMDIFDRYLVYCENCLDSPKIPSNYNGKYMTKEKTILRYMICLYMAIKYFTTLSVPSSFTELVEEVNSTKKVLAEAEVFEQKMLKDILNFKIYRETIFEATDRLNMKLDEYKVRDIIEQYGKVSSCKNIPVSALLNNILDYLRSSVLKENLDLIKKPESS